MFAEILSDLKSRYGDRIFLSPSDLVEVLGVSEGQQANLRSSGRFPIRTTKIGSSVRVSIYDLAKYLSGEAESAAKVGIKKTETVNRAQKKRAKGRLEQGWWLYNQAKFFAVLDRFCVDREVKATDKKLDTLKV